MIAGYNTASKEEKEKYDAKKLCRITDIGMLMVVMLLIDTELFQEVLPAYFVYIIAGIIFADCLIITILGNTICKKSSFD